MYLIQTGGCWWHSPLLGSIQRYLYARGVTLVWLNSKVLGLDQTSLHITKIMHPRVSLPPWPRFPLPMLPASSIPFPSPPLLSVGLRQCLKPRVKQMEVKYQILPFDICTLHLLCLIFSSFIFLLIIFIFATFLWILEESLRFIF